MSDVRVRFAPSPTGFLHIGGLRTALYNYLFARQHGGQFLLRIEDTDQTRYVEEAEPDIRRSMQWAGLEVDEGPEEGGDAGPYYQSQRREHYEQYAKQLLESGHAYLAFDTPEEIDAMRERLQKAGNPSPRYDVVTRMSMRNSITLPEEEVQQLLEDGAPHVVRLKTPRRETIRFEDRVRGAVSFQSAELDDQVLLKSDGLPTYHLANVVDDHLMGITHVIRGEEWLPSTPKHVLLYQYLGWKPPEFAHLPLILSPTGGKLSKRNAEKEGIPVFVKDYTDAGFEPEAVVNFLAFLGWNPGDEREVFSLEELVEAFDLDRVGSSGTQFSMDKLRWFNEQHLRELSPEELAERARPHLEQHGHDPDDAYLVEACRLMQERITKVEELATFCSYFWQDPSDYDEKGLKKRWKADSPELLTAYADRLEALDTFDEETTEGALRDLAEENDKGAGRIIHPTRLAVSGLSFGPSLFELLVTLGQETTIRRLRMAVERLAS